MKKLLTTMMAVLVTMSFTAPVMNFYKKYGQLIGYIIVLAFVIYVYRYLNNFGV